jgi:DNA-binding response OmpR family regulator
MLSNARILVVEDEMLIGLVLSDAIEAAEGEVVGPARSVAEAIEVIEDDGIDGAILDRTLLDGKVTPVAVMLVERAIPFIFYSGSEPDLFKEEFPAVRSFQKPIAPEHVSAGEKIPQ